MDEYYIINQDNFYLLDNIKAILEGEYIKFEQCIYPKHQTVFIRKGVEPKDLVISWNNSLQVNGFQIYFDKERYFIFRLPYDNIHKLFELNYYWFYNNFLFEKFINDTEKSNKPFWEKLLSLVKKELKKEDFELLELLYNSRW